REDRKVHPLPAVFARQKLTIKEGETTEPLEVRAVPHVVIEAQYLDSKGQPRSGHDCLFHGRIDGNWWNAMARPNASGRIVLHAPHGLEKAQLDLSTNEHGALRHRMSKDAPLSNSRNVMLGTLDHDVKGIEIIRYEAPIVLVKVSTKDGGKPKEIQLSGT